MRPLPAATRTTRRSRSRAARLSRAAARESRGCRTMAPGGNTVAAVIRLGCHVNERRPNDLMTILHLAAQICDEESMPIILNSKTCAVNARDAVNHVRMTREFRPCFSTEHVVSDCYQAEGPAPANVQRAVRGCLCAARAGGASAPLGCGVWQGLRGLRR